MNELFINNESPEIIDDIESYIDSTEKKSEIYQALKILSIIDSQVQEYDIDLTYDWEKFYFIIKNERLRLPMNVDQIEEYWNIVKDLLNNNSEIWITGKADFRYIYEVPFIWWVSRWKKIFYLWTKPIWNVLNKFEAINNNNIVEELYRFTQTVKNIPKEKWIIKNWIWTADTIWFT